MSTPILIIGDSGSGKTNTLRNMDPTKVLLLQSIRRNLPFKNTQWKPFDPALKEGNIIVTDKASEILGIMQNTKRKIIVLDDFQYVMSNEFMRRHDETGFNKFTEIGWHAWSILRMAANLAPDVRVYVLAHSITDDSGWTKMKTIGKLLDEKITPEGMFSIVFRTRVQDDKYFLTTRNHGQDPSKTPMDMFKAELIDNDLAVIDKTICEYYGIT